MLPQQALPLQYLEVTEFLTLPEPTVLVENYRYPNSQLPYPLLPEVNLSVPSQHAP